MDFAADRTALGALAALAALAAPVHGAGCEVGAPPAGRSAYVSVAIWTDIDFPDGIDSIRAVLSQGGVEREASRALRESGEPMPFVIGLSAAWMIRTEPIDLVVEGTQGPLTVVRRRVRIGRLPAGPSAIAVALEARCAGVACDGDWTCIGGLCDRPDAPLDAVVPSVADLPDGGPLRTGPGRRVDGCTADSDCEDGDPCTIDACAAHQCARSTVPSCHPCSTDEDCAVESTDCMIAFCHEYGICQWRTRPPETPCRGDGDPCTVWCCRELGSCMGFEICEHPERASECDGE